MATKVNGQAGTCPQCAETGQRLTECSGQVTIAYTTIGMLWYPTGFP